MDKIIFYKFGIIGVLALVALWSFHALPDKNKDDKAILSEEFFKEPVASSSATPSLAPTFSPTNIPVSNLTPTPVLTQKPVLTISPTSSVSLIPTPSALATPSPTSIPTVQPTPVPTLIPSATPTLTPISTPTPTPTPASGHIFYLSTYHTAKYYYCDTDNGWKSLSEKYLKSYPSEQELLADYPGKILHEPCK
ncbi:MAG: hypothetical protein Q8Q89_01930 [bacterium]|nr:hypothetical protein [bacterium]